LQHWAHFAPVQFCLVQWVQAFCFFALPPPAYAAGPASIRAVMANRNVFLILFELNELKNRFF
jgi:hypothetical protein